MNVKFNFGEKIGTVLLDLCMFNMFTVSPCVQFLYAYAISIINCIAFFGS